MYSWRHWADYVRINQYRSSAPCMRASKYGILPLGPARASLHLTRGHTYAWIYIYIQVQGEVSRTYQVYLAVETYAEYDLWARQVLRDWIYIEVNSISEPKFQNFNSLWPSDVTWRHTRSGSTLADGTKAELTLTDYHAMIEVLQHSHNNNSTASAPDI